MRKTFVEFITCVALTLSAFCAAVTSASAQQAVTPIFGYDKTWQYYQEGNEPPNVGGLNWRTNTYTDTGTGWLTGNGIFAYEPDAPGQYNPLSTVLNRTVAGGTTQINTYYFRTHFNFPIPTNNTFLYFTNMVDDGLVVYLNGVRVYDIRVSDNPATYASAAGNQGAEGVAELIILTNSARLRQGDNVLAVEVHDTSTTSSDIAFGLGLAYRTLTPIVIVTQPEPRVDAFIGDTLDLSVQVTGDNPRYWWFKDSVFLTNQTNVNLRISNLQTNNAGTYWVVVSNTISGVRSSNSVVTVVPDTVPPELVTAAIGENETNRVVVLFTEDVLPVNNRNFLMSATNVANYSITEVSNPNNKLAINSVTPGRGAQSVRLNLGTNINCSREWVLTVSNLTDLKTNLLARNPSQAIIGCVQRLTPVPYAAIWNYIPTYNEAQPPLPTNWYSTNYQVDANWAIGNSPFYFFNGCNSNCFGNFGVDCPGVGTPVSVGYPTIAFRTEFTISSNSPTVGQLRFEHVIDDGAIFYLNGKELLRYNMTNIAVDYNYLAPCITTNAACRTNTYTLDNLIIGTNVLCAEVHSCDEFTGADFMFGCQLDIIVTNYPTQIPEIKFRKTSNPTRVVLDWQPRGWRLQTSTNLANSNAWVNVAGTTTNTVSFTNNPLAVPRFDWRFWRLCRP